MDSWVKTDKSRNKVTQNVFFTLWRVHTGSTMSLGVYCLKGSTANLPSTILLPHAVE